MATIMRHLDPWTQYGSRSSERGSRVHENQHYDQFGGYIYLRQMVYGDERIPSRIVGPDHQKNALHNLMWFMMNREPRYRLDATTLLQFINEYSTVDSFDLKHTYTRTAIDEFAQKATAKIEASSQAEPRS